MSWYIFTTKYHCEKCSAWVWNLLHKIKETEKYLCAVSVWSMCWFLFMLRNILWMFSIFAFEKYEKCYYIVAHALSALTGVFFWVTFLFLVFRNAITTHRGKRTWQPYAKAGWRRADSFEYYEKGRPHLNKKGFLCSFYAKERLLVLAKEDLYWKNSIFVWLKIIFIKTRCSFSKKTLLLWYKATLGIFFAVSAPIEHSF